MKTNVLETVSQDLCVGCGICSAICPSRAINIEYTGAKEFQPLIMKNACNTCGLCWDYCPQTRKELQELAEAARQEPQVYGIKEDHGFFVAYDREPGRRIRSASGGVVSSLAIYLLEQKDIDGVVHAQPREAKNGERHFTAALSTTVEEIDRRRSSFYAPLSFGEVLAEVRKKPGKYLVVGVPCVIRGMSRLFRDHPAYQKSVFYTAALVCSHNVNGQFIDFLAESCGIDRRTPFSVNLRNKDKIPDADNFNTHFFNKDGDLKKINRFKSLFTWAWRNYMFALNACHYCADFWGREADISIKDAWGKWAKEDPLGKSIIVVRNLWLLEKLLEIEELQLDEIDFATVTSCQSSTTFYKQNLAALRFARPKTHLNNVKSGFLRYDLCASYPKCYIRGMVIGLPGLTCKC